MAERRKSKRVPFRQRIDFVKDGKCTSGYTFNLSKDGIGVKGNGTIMPNIDVSIILNLNNSMLEFNGKIAYCKKTISSEPNLMGVSFENCPAILQTIYKTRSHYEST